MRMLTDPNPPTPSLKLYTFLDTKYFCGGWLSGATSFRGSSVNDRPRSTACIYLTLRRLMSYIYGAPILDVSRSHTTTQHSR